MDILIPDVWLKEFLKTKASTKQIATNLSLCGPSVERVENTKIGPVYSIEVTTNRIDSASVIGIAREAVAILPRFGLKASLREPSAPKLKLKPKVTYLKASVDSSLCKRFTAVLIRNVKIGESPSWMRDRLEAVGIRSLNNIVDVSNYIMIELGQPVHTFDYDKIKNSVMLLRESREGETITTLDGKKHKLLGGDIVIEDGGGSLIDLAGIMGGKNSEVDEKTLNVLLFVQTYEPVRIRKTSMALAHRTLAAALFEKGLDTELVRPAVNRGIELFEKLTGGKPEKEILDIYPHPYKARHVSAPLDFINRYIGIKISEREVLSILESLGFKPRIKGKSVEVIVPSYRSSDIEIPEDLVEEVARIYGYHNIPSKIVTGELPTPNQNSPFKFEKLVKDILKGYGFTEVYTLSLVPKSWAPSGIKLSNPLGSDSEVLRTSLIPSLKSAIEENLRSENSTQLFEMANIYLSKKDSLPEERVMLGVITKGQSYRDLKGILEGLLDELNIKYNFVPNDSSNFLIGHSAQIVVDKNSIGTIGTLGEGLEYFELEVAKLKALYKQFVPFRHIHKFPPQVEDITLIIPPRTKVGEVVEFILNTENRISGFELKDIFNNSYTFRIMYQIFTKTLTDKEVEKIRTGLISKLERKFGIKV